MGLIWSFAHRDDPDVNDGLLTVPAMIMQGQSFKPDEISHLLSQIDVAEAAARCDQTLLLSALTLEGDTTDKMGAGQTDALVALDNFDKRLVTIETTARHLVQCSPHQSFGWLSLFWVRVLTNGTDPVAVQDLAMSYDTAPREAWIGIRRNPLALRAFQALPADLQSKAIEEFVALLRGDLVRYSAETFRTTPAPVRALLINRLKTESLDLRKRLADRLSSIGFDPPDELYSEPYPLYLQ